MYTFEQDNKTYLVRNVPGSPLVMIQEIYKTKDSPTGYYCKGLIHYVDPNTGEVKYTS